MFSFKLMLLKGPGKVYNYFKGRYLTHPRKIDPEKTSKTYFSLFLKKQKVKTYPNLPLEASKLENEN